MQAACSCPRAQVSAHGLLVRCVGVYVRCVASYGRPLSASQDTGSRADKILSLMGEGTFGRVLECWDREQRDTVAVKVIRSVPKYRDAAMIEVRAPTRSRSTQ